MSIKVMIHIFDLPEGSLTSSQKFVAVSYADHADDTGRNIFPAVATIAKKTALTPRTVQRCTRQLETMKLFLQDGKHPKYGTNQWRIDLSWRGDTVSGVTTDAADNEESEGGVTPDAENMPPLSPEPPSLTGKKKKSKDQPSTEREKAPEKMSPLLVFNEVTGLHPTLPQQKLITDAFKDRPHFTIEFLKPYWDEWVGRGYGIMNIAWLADWATDGRIPSKTRGNQSNGKPPPPPSFDPTEYSGDDEPTTKRKPKYQIG